MFGENIMLGAVSSACFTDTTDIFKDNSALALYTLDYDASDTGGVTGNFNEGVVLNGANNVSIPGSILGDFHNAGTHAISISSWVYFLGPTSETYAHVISLGYNQAGKAIWVGMWYNGNTVSNELYLGGPSVTALWTGFSMPVNQWTHLVLTYTGTSAKLYINKTLTTTLTTTTLDWRSSGNAFKLGEYYYNTNYKLKGHFDQTRIFNRAITQTEVNTLNGETDATTNTLQILGDSSCKATYTFDGSLNDLSGNYNATSSGIFKYNGGASNVDFGVGGKSLYGARFNGSSSRIDLPTGSLGFSTNNFSVSCWFNSADITQNDQSLFWFQHNQSPVRFGAQLSQASYGGDGDVRFYCTIAGTGTNLFTNSNIISSDTWYHAVFVKSSTSGMTIYINGSSVATNSATGAVNNNVTSGGTNTIGAYQTTNSSGYFNGSIDQFRMFNKALSSSEISKLYGNGAGEIACKYTATTNTHMFGCIANYNFDNGAKESMGASSYDATESNVEYRFGRFGQAAVFNGSNAYIQLPLNTGSFFAGKNNLTVSLWFKTNGSVSANSVLFADYNNESYNMFSRLDSSGNLYVANRFNMGTNSTTGSVAYDDSNWHHLVITNNVSSLTQSVYVDGSLVFTNSMSSNSWSSTATGRVSLGANYSTSGSAYANFFDGSLDQVRIYTATLTSSQITELYNEKPEIDTSNFKTVLWDGTSAENYISQVGMDLETNGGLVWIKQRSAVNTNHRWFDSVRGVTQLISSSNTDIQGSNSETLKSFEKNGFILGTNTAVNDTGDTFVGWCWKGGGTAVSNTDGTITSSVSANADAGFSIVKWTGTGVNGKTIGHGLGAAPELIITKGLSNATSWVVGIGGVSGMSVNDYLTFTTYDKANSSTFYQAYSTNTFQVGVSAANEMNKSASNDYISYCFRSISGYSSIGTYSGTNSSGNTAITGLGFTPSWFMAKRLDADGPSFTIHDNRRVESNGNLGHLFADTSTAEGSSGYDVDFVTGGVTINSTSTNLNASGTNNYLYMVFK